MTKLYFISDDALVALTIEGGNAGCDLHLRGNEIACVAVDPLCPQLISVVLGQPLSPQALEQALRAVNGVAVFIGCELGGWQKREMWFALDRQVREEKEGGRKPRNATEPAPRPAVCGTVYVVDTGIISTTSALDCGHCHLCSAATMADRSHQNPTGLL